MLSLLKQYLGPWEKVRGNLIADLDHLQSAVNTRWAATFGDDNLLNPATISPTSTFTPIAWTPVIGGSGGTSGQVYSTQVGTYVKIGRLVLAQFATAFSTKGTITSAVQLQGLPFYAATPTTLVTVRGAPLGFASLTSNWITISPLFASVSKAATLTGLTAAATTNLSTLSTFDLTDSSAFSGVLCYHATS